VASDKAATHSRVTFIVAAYNAEKTLAGAIDSVVRQACGDWEVIVVDDGSTDRTLEIATSYSKSDSRIRALPQDNAGTGAARNTALSHVVSEFVCYLDADDMLADDYLPVMLDLMRRHQGLDIYSSDGTFVREDGSREPVFGYREEVSLTTEDLIEGCMILGGGALIRTDALRALGGFREHMYGEDYDLWLRALASGHTHVASPRQLYVYHESVQGRKSEDRVAGIGSAVAALEDLLRSGLLREDQADLARLRLAGYRSDLSLELQAQRLRKGVERVCGVCAAPAIVRAIHRVSWVTRPLRRLLADRSAVRHDPPKPSGSE
jgi:GT2 family glycosyltransferase